MVAAITPVKKVLILGAYGMLGYDLQHVFPGAVLRGHDLDITDAGKVTAALRDIKPALVINAAAYTDVDGCEDHRDVAFGVNGDALLSLARACKDAGACLIHYSTDYVFDGTRTSYREIDVPHPVNAYGESKLLGEKHIRETMDDYRIIRTSWLFGTHGKNFVETMLRLSREMPEVRVVNDQFGKPTYTADLAQKTAGIAGLDPGIYHITNEGVCSWFEFARAIIQNVVPCSTAEYPRRAQRPAYSVLVNTKTTPMRSWNEALTAYLKEREA
ncbi:MAG: dTDP-4-dehydrorhamnose reductase [Methanoregula sp.]|jgi:dTDP-4-dehydrorhamnose reductase|uniref:dTDP-4-dehydrorhamnose reductase n=1 Tax=Methanoregula sp. TaxID=2052170 RepID=UPI003C2617C1